jgi:L-lactate utilization protein LutC
MSDLVEAFATAAAASGAHVHRDVDPAEIVAGRNEDEVGVSHAAFGLADTGSVVLAAGPDEPRARSLLPPVHVTVLDASCRSCRTCSARSTASCPAHFRS